MPPGEPTEWYTPLLHEVGAQFDGFSRLWKMQSHMVSRFAAKCAQHGPPDHTSAPAAEPEDDATAGWRAAWPVMPDLPQAVVNAAQTINVYLREQGFERGSILGLRFGPDEREALHDMLEDARADLEAIRAKLGVPDEPHQSLQERTLEAVDRLKQDNDRRRVGLLAWIDAAIERNEEADRLKRDAERYHWVRPIVTGDDDEVVNKRLLQLGLALASGLTGDAAIDAARSAGSTPVEAT